MDIGALFRTKNMIDAAATTEPSELSAKTLTSAYVRLRIEVLGLVAGTDLEEDFDRVFDEIQIAETPNMRLAGNSGRQQRADVVAEAVQAKDLLGQMSGWVQGLIDEQLLDRKLHAEAEAKAQLESKPRPGFAAS